MRIWIKGAGDIASGIAVRLHHCGMQIIMTEIDRPTMVRRTVSFANCIYETDGIMEIEGIKAELVDTKEQMERSLRDDKIAVVQDSEGKYREWYEPDVIVDAILAKKNLGTFFSEASLVIGVGPGFHAGTDCHYVVETKRGHELGRVIEFGEAIPNTGIPGEIGGFSKERLIKSTIAGVFKPCVNIGDIVKKGDVVAYVEKEPLYAQMDGMVRGMLSEGLTVSQNMKCGDIDSSYETRYCHTVSDKARAVGGGVLEAILRGAFRMKPEIEA